MKPRRLNLRQTTRSPLALGRAPGTRAVTYHALEGGWWLWCPCHTCGGVAVPLRECCEPGRDPASGQACPGCEAHRRRGEAAAPDPTVWYDTWLEDWVVRLPCRGMREGVLMPMEIRWFDAAWSDVIRTAADIAFGAET